MEAGDLQRSYLLRKVLHPMSPIDAMEFILSRITKSKTNAQFLDSMNS
jgi:transcription termination factor Rho